MIFKVLSKPLYDYDSNMVYIPISETRMLSFDYYFSAEKATRA